MAKSYFVALSEEIEKKGGKGYQKGAILLIISSNGGNKKKLPCCWNGTKFFKRS